MGVYLPNVKKPKSAYDPCPIRGESGECQYFDEYEFCGNIFGDCPLIDIVQCKDCKWFELDVWGELNGIPLIIAHEMCEFWGGGCKTNPNGFCSYGERSEE